MPYIKPEERYHLLDEEFNPTTIGQLNFCITRMCLDYLPDKPSYACFNEIIGVLECAKLEMYRRAVSPYEDQKKAENGDILGYK